MNEGVAILLERMKTHPEEFVSRMQYGATKWGNLISQYNEYFTTEESEAISKAFKDTTYKVMRERFTAEVMGELIDPKEENAPYPYANTAINTAGMTLTVPNGGSATQWVNNGTGATTLSSNSLTLGSTSVNENDLKQIKAQIKAMQDEKQKMLVGKLKNYLGNDE
jgi:hypothetical protein